MKRILVQTGALLVCLFLALPAAAAAHRDSVGLGVSIGVAFPQGKTDHIQANEWDGSFNWGFYVNIPIIWTFHLTPSAELYKLNGSGANSYATDISLAFKFIVPLSILNFYAGFVPGLTATGDAPYFNVGGLIGVSFNIISNIDLFVEAKYKFIIESDRNMRVLHLNSGVLFYF